MNDATDAFHITTYIRFDEKNDHPRHRKIHTDRTSHQREAGTNYDRNDNQISDFGVMNDATNGFDAMAYGRFNGKKSIIVTARSIRRELAINEKQRSTTTEMTTKSVSLES